MRKDFDRYDVALFRFIKLFQIHFLYWAIIVLIIKMLS